MNERIALLGIVEILSAVSCGIFILFITYRMLRIYGRKKLQLDHNNLAYNIVIAGVLFSVGYIVSGVIQPILNSFRFLSDTAISKTELILSFIGYGGLYIAIAFIFSVLICFTGAKIYSSMTPLNEAEEIKANNVGVAIVLVAIICTLALMSTDGIALLIESFIPYPELPPRIG